MQAAFRFQENVKHKHAWQIPHTNEPSAKASRLSQNKVKGSGVTDCALEMLFLSNSFWWQVCWLCWLCFSTHPFFAPNVLPSSFSRQLENVISSCWVNGLESKRTSSRAMHVSVLEQSTLSTRTCYISRRVKQCEVQRGGFYKNTVPASLFTQCFEEPLTIEAMTFSQMGKIGFLPLVWRVPALF